MGAKQGLKLVAARGQVRVGNGSTVAQGSGGKGGNEDPQGRELGFGEFGVLAFVGGDEGKAFGDATADVVKVRGIAVGFQEAGGLGEGSQESEVDRGVGMGLGEGLEPQVYPARFSEDFVVEGNLAKGTEEFFEELLGKLVMGIMGHGGGLNVNWGLWGDDLGIILGGKSLLLARTHPSNPIGAVNSPQSPNNPPIISQKSPGNSLVIPYPPIIPQESLNLLPIITPIL